MRKDLTIVGAGFAGLYMLHRVRQLGLTATVVESAPDVGGTWYWNAYPGARCDVPSLRYSYGFDDDLQSDWEWTEKYATQPEILAYLRHVVDRFDLRRDIQFNHTVTGAEFDASTERWKVFTDGATTIDSAFVIAAVGCLSSFQTPSFPGGSISGGDIYATGRWPQEGVDLSGERVVVVGTGSSGIQLIPEIARQAEHLTVLQRTANFSVPARNGQIDPVLLHQVTRDYRGWREKLLADNGCRNGARDPDAHFASTSSVEIRRILDKRWAEGGAAFLGPFPEIMTDPEVNRFYADYVRGRIAEIVDDKPTAALLASQDFPIGTKRICVDTDYYGTFNRPNVRLKDIRNDPIVEFTPLGLRTASEDLPADVVVLATGFDAMTGSFIRLGAVGRSGESLREIWAEGPKTYLGLQTARFPNLFFIAGPGSPSVLSNMVCSIEHHVDFIAGLLRYMRAHDLTVVEVDSETQQQWTTHVGEVAERTLYPVAASWYMGANVPGKKRVFMPYVGPGRDYVQRCDQVAAKGYEGFTFTSTDDHAVGCGSTAKKG